MEDAQAAAHDEIEDSADELAEDNAEGDLQAAAQDIAHHDDADDNDDTQVRSTDGSQVTQASN